MAKVGIVGFGELGTLIARRARKAAYEVIAYNAGRTERPPYSESIMARAAEIGVRLVEKLQDITEESDAIFLAVPADATASVLQVIEPGASVLIIDLTSAIPSVKRLAYQMLGECYVDGVVLGPATGGHNVRIIVAGHDRGAELLRKLEFDVVQVEGPPGMAAGLKCLWQVVSKGMQALLVEALVAARILGIKYEDPPPITVGDKVVEFPLPIPLLPHMLEHADRKARDLNQVVHELQRAGFEAPLSAAGAAILARAPELLEGFYAVGG